MICMSRLLNTISMNFMHLVLCVGNSENRKLHSALLHLCSTRQVFIRSRQIKIFFIRGYGGHFNRIQDRSLWIFDFVLSGFLEVLKSTADRNSDMNFRRTLASSPANRQAGYRLFGAIIWRWQLTWEIQCVKNRNFATSFKFHAPGSGYLCQYLNLNHIYG